MDAGAVILICFLLVLSFGCWWAEAPILSVGVVIVAVAVGIYNDDIAARSAERDRKQQEQRVADAKPRPVSHSTDGCTVYAFKPQDRWLYFTRCAGAQTSTMNVERVCNGSGKYRHCEDVHTNIDTHTLKEQSK